MTNPDNALGTNGAFGGRTSVNAFNDVLATFDSAGIVSGFAVAPDTGMTVEVGGSGTIRDVAVAEDPFGNRTTVDNISGDPIPVTIDTASTTTARIDSIVAYVNSPANASDTSVDNPTACGIISVNGTSGGAPTDAAIRTAITADGGTGSTAYYVVIANVSVPANTTTITSGLISAGKSINLTNVATTGSNGLMSDADKTALNNATTKLQNITFSDVPGVVYVVIPTFSGGDPGSIPQNTKPVLDYLYNRADAVGTQFVFSGTAQGVTVYWGTGFRQSDKRVCITIFYQNKVGNYTGANAYLQNDTTYAYVGIPGTSI